MAKNTDLTKLDYDQAAKRCIEDSNDAMRVVVASGTEFEIGLSSSEGDSVLINNDQDSDSFTLATTMTGELLVLDSSMFEKVQIFSKTLTAISGEQPIVLEVSPVPSGDFWITGGGTVTPAPTLNATRSSSIVEICASRVRVTTASAIISGTAEIVVVLRS